MVLFKGKIIFIKYGTHGDKYGDIDTRGNTAHLPPFFITAGKKGVNRLIQVSNVPEKLLETIKVAVIWNFQVLELGIVVLYFVRYTLNRPVMCLFCLNL